MRICETPMNMTSFGGFTNQFVYPCVKFLTFVTVSKLNFKNLCSLFINTMLVFGK